MGTVPFAETERNSPVLGHCDYPVLPQKEAFVDHNGSSSRVAGTLAVQSTYSRVKGGRTCARAIGDGQGWEAKSLVGYRGSTAHLPCTPSSYAEGARRGLREELGIVMPTSVELEKLCEPFLQENSYPELGVTDREFVTCYKATFAGEVTPDGVEVVAIQWLSPATLQDKLKTEPAIFAPWFTQTLEQLRKGGWGKV